jgi:electron transfer flavoprotein alpha subunit
MLDRAFVIAEQRQGSATGQALELCTAAREIAGEVLAFTWSAGAGGAADQDAAPGSGRPGTVPAQLASYGATRVFDLGSLGESLAGTRVAAAVAGEAACALEVPAAVLAPASYDGRDIAARLSARLDRPVLANVSGIEVDPSTGRLVSSHLLFGGAKVARARFSGPPPWIFVVVAKSFSAVEAGAPTSPEVVLVPARELGPTDAARVVARHGGQHEGPSLEEAQVVVSGGRGLGSPDQYALIVELAKLLGGAPGATRAIVDAGWAPYAYQVGQTGRTVKPEVYLAFGISGATQHLVGMKGAGYVIAVNSDAEAPMVKVADLGIVGDAPHVLRRLVEAVKGRVQGPSAAIPSEAHH